jgi:hypothetical protein
MYLKEWQRMVSKRSGCRIRLTATNTILYCKDNPVFLGQERKWRGDQRSANGTQVRSMWKCNYFENYYGCVVCLFMLTSNVVDHDYLLTVWSHPRSRQLLQFGDVVDEDDYYEYLCDNSIWQNRDTSAYFRERSVSHAPVGRARHVGPGHVLMT